MKKKAFIFLVLLFLSPPLFAFWVTDGGQFVTGNYGTYEDGFHDAIDVSGDGGTTKCVAVARMQLINIQKQRNSYNADFYLPNESIYIAFSHINKLGSSPFRVGKS